MCYSLWILIILLGWKVFCSDGAVTLSIVNSVDEGNKLECDTEVTLVCKIDPFSNLISWNINSTLYAFCSPLCSENPPFPGNYSFTYDVASGIFNLTINQVTFTDSNTHFQCDDGSELASHTTEVVPAYSGNETTVVINDEEYQLVFKTACVHPDVQFEWFTVKVNNLDRVAYKTNQNESEERTLCELDNKCGGTGTARVSSSVTVAKVSSGEERLLEVVVTYKNPNENRIFRFNDTFIFEDLGPGPGPGPCPVPDDCCILLIVAGCAYLIHIILGLLLFVPWNGRDNSTEDKYCPSAFEYLNVFCVLLWIVMFAVYIGSLVICNEDEDDCLCSKIVCVLGYIFLALLGVHIVLGGILLYVLYCGKVTVLGKDEKCSTSKASCIRSTCCAIPVAGLFAVCQWLMCLYCSKKHEPDPPTEFTLIDGSVTETCIGFKWKPGFDGGYPQTFILTYKVNGQLLHSSVKDSGQDLMKHKLRDLSKGTYYSVTIFAQNDVGKSSPVGPLYVRTKGKPNKPTDFKLSGENSVTESSITVEWKPGFDGGFPQTFKLCYEGNGNTGQASVPDKTSQHTMTHTFEKLSKGTKYTIRIFATNQKGDSLQQDPLVVQTKDKFQHAALPNIYEMRNKGVQLPVSEKEHEHKKISKHLTEESSNVSDKASTSSVIIETNNIESFKSNNSTTADRKTVPPSNTAGVSLSVRNMNSWNNGARHTDSSSRTKQKKIDERISHGHITQDKADNQLNSPEVDNSSHQSKKSLNAEKHTKSDTSTMTRALSANFTDKNDKTTEVSGDSSETSKGESTTHSKM